MNWIRWVTLLSLAAVGAHLAGCGNKGNVVVPAAAPANTAVTPAEAPPTAPASPLPAPRTPAPPTPRQRTTELSGDTELSGSNETFVMLDDPQQGGSLWEVDGDENVSVDRFAYASLAANVDSSRFTIEPAAPGGQTTSGSPAVVATLPEGFTAIAEGGFSPEGWPLRIECAKDGSIMALVPQGSFMQGTNGGDPNAAPEHAVRLDAYYIDVYETTYEKFEKFRDAARGAKRPVAEPPRKPAARNEPVTGITWGEARAYAQWSGRDLPTEAEWEMAARGPRSFRFPWGNGRFIWHRARRPDQIDPVGSFAGDLSTFGVYDLAGNAREWCSDAYGEKYYEQLVRESGATANKPTGPKPVGASRRVVKGGHPDWYAWARDGVSISERRNDVGFRCVLRLKEAAEKTPAEKRTGTDRKR